MPINADIHYQKAENEYNNASTTEEKIKTLENMISKAPSHKGAETLRKNLKTRLAKLKSSLEKSSRKGSFQKFKFKKEGAATVCLVGTVNSGKSTLLKKLTNANVLIASYLFTTKKPEFGILDYYGIKLQLVEIPAIVNDFIHTDDGKSLLGIINSCDLVVLLFNTPSDKKILDVELFDVKVKKIIYIENENIKDKIWKNLDLIKIYTKEPSKPKAYPPVALDKESSVRNLGLKVHKDFIKNFDYAIVNGDSVKFKNMRCGLNHVLKDDDIVEFHIKK